MTWLVKHLTSLLTHAFIIMLVLLTNDGGPRCRHQRQFNTRCQVCEGVQTWKNTKTHNKHLEARQYWNKGRGNTKTKWLHDKKQVDKTQAKLTPCCLNLFTISAAFWMGAVWGESATICVKCLIELGNTTKNCVNRTKQELGSMTQKRETPNNTSTSLLERCQASHPTSNYTNTWKTISQKLLMKEVDTKQLLQHYHWPWKWLVSISDAWSPSTKLGFCGSKSFILE